MAFKKTTPASPVPDSPEKILLDLPRRRIAGVLLHQGEVMKAYAAQAVDLSDVALQLPTGSGKTLVALMIGEWRRRKFGERVLYLCPTKQLVHQVAEQAMSQYGLGVTPFVGSKSEYSADAKSQYFNAERIAVTVYQSLFNVKPFFDSANFIIIDDAHVAENYIASYWSFRLERTNADHESIHSALAGLLKPIVGRLYMSATLGAGG